MSPNLNLIDHIWNMLGRRIHAREPHVQNIRQLEAALHRGWKQQCIGAGSSIASGMAAAITTGHPTSNWRDETQG